MLTILMILQLVQKNTALKIYEVLQKNKIKWLRINFIAIYVIFYALKFFNNVLQIFLFLFWNVFRFISFTQI